MSGFSLVGPPAFLFFKDGREIRSQRIIGEVSTEELIERLNSLNWWIMLLSKCIYFDAMFFYLDGKIPEIDIK